MPKGNCKKCGKEYQVQVNSQWEADYIKANAICDHCLVASIPYERVDHDDLKAEFQEQEKKSYLEAINNAQY